MFRSWPKQTLCTEVQCSCMTHRWVPGIHELEKQPKYKAANQLNSFYIPEGMLSTIPTNTIQTFLQAVNSTEVSNATSSLSLQLQNLFLSEGTSCLLRVIKIFRGSHFNLFASGTSLQLAEVNTWQLTQKHNGGKQPIQPTNP